MVFEIIFMLVILKIPIVYICVVVWWAIKAEPMPPEPTEAVCRRRTRLRPTVHRGGAAPTGRVRRGRTRDRGRVPAPHRGGVHA